MHREIDLVFAPLAWRLFCSLSAPTAPRNNRNFGGHKLLFSSGPRFESSTKLWESETSLFLNMVHMQNRKEKLHTVPGRANKARTTEYSDAGLTIKAKTISQFLCWTFS
jgi:hypothetical protein